MPIPEGVLPFALKEDKVFIPIQFQVVIYDLKPTVCSVCKSFGHIEAKCPTTNPSTSLRRPKPPVRPPTHQWRPVAKPKGPGFGLSKVRNQLLLQHQCSLPWGLLVLTVRRRDPGLLSYLLQRKNSKRRPRQGQRRSRRPPFGIASRRQDSMSGDQSCPVVQIKEQQPLN